MDINASPVLLPCPFCGHYTAKVYKDDCGDYGPASYLVECEHCNASAGSSNSEIKAIENWNRRM